MFRQRLFCTPKATDDCCVSFLYRQESGSIIGSVRFLQDRIPVLAYPEKTMQCLKTGGIWAVHLVYCDKKAKVLQKILSGEKTMVVRGAAGRKILHGRVLAGETLYFMEQGSKKIPCPPLWRKHSISSNSAKRRLPRRSPPMRRHLI